MEKVQLVLRVGVGRSASGCAGSDRISEEESNEGEGTSFLIALGCRQRSEVRGSLAVAEDTLDYEHAVFGNSRRVSRPKATSPTLTY